MSQYSSHSPPPLRHPVPTHPAYIPEPPSTPASPQGYQRFSSSPAPPNAPPHLQNQNQNAYVQAYTSPFQHSQGPPQQQQQQHAGYGQPQQQPGGPYGMSGSMGGPGVHGQQGHAQGGQDPYNAAWSFDNATAQLGMQLGQNAVAAGQDYVQRNWGTILPSNNLKHHFNVSNLYVIKKLQLVLFPWRHKPWSRRIRAQAQGDWLPPRDDINSPDLYIPVMAMVTYVLLASLHAGLNGDFRPQLLGDLASRTMVVVFLDVAFVKLGCYILNIQNSSQVVDLVAYGGYKVVGVILTIAAGILGLKGPVWSMIFVYVFLANAFFLLRSLRAVILPDASNAPASQAAATLTPATRRRRITFLFLEAVTQVLYMGWLVRI